MKPTANIPLNDERLAFSQDLEYDNSFYSHPFYLKFTGVASWCSREI